MTTAEQKKRPDLKKKPKQVKPKQVKPKPKQEQVKPKKVNPKSNTNNYEPIIVIGNPYDLTIGPYIPGWGIRCPKSGEFTFPRFTKEEMVLSEHIFGDYDSVVEFEPLIVE